MSKNLFQKGKKLRIPHEMKMKIINSVVKKLKVKDYFKLKDRMDGVFFLRKQFRRIYSSYYFEKLHNIKLLNGEKPLFCKTEFEISNERYLVVGTYTPLKIKIPKKDNISFFLVIKVVEDPASAEYLGKISYSKCIEISSGLNLLKSNNVVNEEPIAVISKMDLVD